MIPAKKRPSGSQEPEGRFVRRSVVRPVVVALHGQAGLMQDLAEGVGKVEVVDAELVGHDDIAVVGDPEGHPVVAVMATPAALMPLAAHTPRAGSTLGVEV